MGSFDACMGGGEGKQRADVVQIRQRLMPFMKLRWQRVGRIMGRLA